MNPILRNVDYDLLRYVYIIQDLGDIDLWVTSVRVSFAHTSTLLSGRHPKRIKDLGALNNVSRLIVRCREGTTVGLGNSHPK
jgi:hypothetical protein